MKRQTQHRTPRHEKFANGQLPNIRHEQVPLPENEWIPRLLEVAQHSRDHHDGKTDPKEDEEAAEVAVLAAGVEVRDSRVIVDRGKHAAFLLGADGFAGRGGGLHGGGCVWRDGRGGFTAACWYLHVGDCCALFVCESRCVSTLGGMDKSIVLTCLGGTLRSDDTPWVLAYPHPAATRARLNVTTVVHAGA